MQVRVKNTINELPILILSNNAEVAYKIAQYAELAAYNVLVATSFDDLEKLLERVHPQVIIAFDDGDSCLDLFQAFVTHSEISNRPILISISDNPSNDLFEVSDQVIPTSYLPSIGQIITTHIARFQKTALQERQRAELEANNLHLSQNLAIANQTSAEISLLKPTSIELLVCI